MIIVLARSLNTAWLSVASSVAALVIPAAYGVDGSVEWVAICLAAIFTALGAVGMRICLQTLVSPCLDSQRAFSSMVTHSTRETDK